MKKDINTVEKLIKPKIAIYARVSSQKQKDEETIESQIDALKLYAKENNYPINDEFIFLDNGVSGSTMQRPGLDELRDMVRFDAINVILMYAPDRLSRNYTHQLILMEEFRKYGVKICFLKHPPDTSTPEAKMFQHFQGIFAEYERALFLDRSRRGRIYKAKLGDPSVIPSVPYGYRKLKTENRSSVVIVDDEATVVKEIFRLYIYESHSIYAVASKITESGKKPRKGGPTWEVSTVTGILKNTTYLGTSHFGKTEKCEGKLDTIRKYKSKTYTKAKYATRLRPEEEWIPITVPQIISENDFELAQEKMKMNAQYSSRNTKEPGLLQGLITCGVCGQPYYKRMNYYYCRSKANAKFKKCSNKPLRQDKTDEYVFREVLQLLQQPDIIEKELLRRDEETKNTEELAQQEAVLKKELAKISSESERLLDAYQTSIIELDDLKKRNHALDVRKKNIEKDILCIRALRLKAENKLNFRDLFDNTIKKIQSKAEGLSISEKRKLVRLLVEQVTVNLDSITLIHCVSPVALTQEKCLLQARDV